MRFLAVGQSPVGIIAIGQDATGVIAIGQLACGVVAIGQLARGVFAVGQLALGVFAAGQLSVSVLFGAGIGIGATAAHGGPMLGFFGRLRPTRLFDPRAARILVYEKMPAWRVVFGTAGVATLAGLWWLAVGDRLTEVLGTI